MIGMSAVLGKKNMIDISKEEDAIVKQLEDAMREKLGQIIRDNAGELRKFRKDQVKTISEKYGVDAGDLDIVIFYHESAASLVGNYRDKTIVILTPNTEIDKRGAEEIYSRIKKYDRERTLKVTVLPRIGRDHLVQTLKNMSPPASAAVIYKKIVSKEKDSDLIDLTSIANEAGIKDVTHIAYDTE